MGRHLAAGIRDDPPKTEYGLTAVGETLRPVMTAMADWGEKTLELQSAEAK